MEKKQKNKIIFALVGKNISHSFSKSYFTEKFKDMNLNNYQYVNFDLDGIEFFPNIYKQNKNSLKGLNITIPYKEEIIPYLDKISKKAKKIGAINVVKIDKKGYLKGYNTDEYGFKKSITPLLKKHHKKALILGTGGASKAILYALKKLKIKSKFVSRNPKKEDFSYKMLSEKILKEYTIIINCTPLGTFPCVKNYPKIPYQFITEKHLLYDLVYNPNKTKFLIKGEKKGAVIKNGLEMLELQAEKAWKIWSEN